jgi:hypothetical protein
MQTMDTELRDKPTGLVLSRQKDSGSAAGGSALI